MNFTEEDFQKLATEVKEFVIGRMFVDDEGKETIHESVPIGSDEDMVNPNEVIINQDDIKITFDYPLSNKVEKEFSSDGDGFTRHEVWEAVKDGYEEIYAEEDAAVGDPGTIGENSPPGSPSSKMINRSQSHGPHGI